MDLQSICKFRLGVRAMRTPQKRITKGTLWYAWLIVVSEQAE